MDSLHRQPSIPLFLVACLTLPAGLWAQEVEVKEVPAPVKVQPGTPTPPQGVTQGRSNSGNSWFETTDLDLGTYFHHENAVGRFRFKNPTDKAQEWRNLQGSCTCSKSQIQVGDRRYEMQGKSNDIYRVTSTGGVEQREKVRSIEVAPGEEGEVEVHMEMNGITGVRQASLDIYTTDPEAPMLKLKFQATGAVMFQLTPPEVNLNKMTWNEQRDFLVQVTSPVAKDFNILGHDQLPPDMTVQYEKSMQDGLATWTIRGTYGPLKAETGGGGVINFRSDLQGSPTFQLRVLAFVEGPLKVEPGTFVTLGMIRTGSAKTGRVTFEPNDGTDLQAVQLRFEKLSVPEKFVTAKASKEGNLLHVDLEISPETPQGLLRGDLVVELNHPAIKEKRILFNGFVR